ncbi:MULTISPECIES: dihydrofolate reductase family protein [Asticcacaulis]|uniref:dihydrofolate reductase family protein n=1 Tax=Asticcacaulis TaxID=76890 RepID=UPI001AE91FD3|nr:MULTISPECIES: dihydrofolate reductase family protein [Asticcacaulis]MBP2158935.1 dihydrofolate reductase [Asticcacaulis solisilvae]MDR6799980.1 dihydrofolate reductase [Asticcacaulis sp. BE141]
MRKIIVGTFVSLDSIMQAPGGPEEDPTGGFKYGGWSTTYWDDVIEKAMGETFAEPFDLLLGRKTYDIFAAHWPYVEQDPVADSFDKLNGDIAKMFNGITKYVATHHPESLGWVNSEALGDDIPARLHDLKASDGPTLLVQGSSELIQILLEHDLVDEFRLLIYPLVLGEGKRLFGSGTQPVGFKVTKSVVSPSGVILVTYERAGGIKTGSFAMENPTEAELERRRTLS